MLRCENIKYAHQCFTDSILFEGWSNVLYRLPDDLVNRLGYLVTHAGNVTPNVLVFAHVINEHAERIRVAFAVQRRAGLREFPCYTPERPLWVAIAEGKPAGYVPMRTKNPNRHIMICPRTVVTAVSLNFSRTTP